MKQKFLSILLTLLVGIVLISSSFSAINEFSYINSVHASSTQGVNEHIAVNRIVQLNSYEVEVDIPFQIIILVDNLVDQPVYDVVVNQTIPSSSSGNTLNITAATSNTFNKTWAAETFNTILPGDRRSLNVTLEGYGNSTWGTITLPSLNVTYSFSEDLIPAWKQSDIDPQGTPRPLTFNITNSSVEVTPRETCRGSNCIDINLISPVFL